MQEKSIIFPMRFNSLVIETTTRCNAKCAMCYQSSGPKGHDLLGIKELKTDILKKVIADSTKIPNLESRLHLAGGEAFLNEEQVFELLSHGRNVGFENITMTTNAFWGSSEERANRICERLSECGMTDLEISWDYWHLAYIEPERVNRVLKVCQEHSIDTTLRVLTSKNHSVGEALSLLGDGWLYAEKVLPGKVFGSGRAESDLEVGELFNETVGKYQTCHSFLNLTVNATGEVYPCCAGLDQTNHIQLGNVYQEAINTIAKRMTNNLWLRQLVFDGVVSIESVVREKNRKFVVDDEKGMCTRCWKLFSDSPAVDTVKQHGRDVGERIIKEAFAHVLEASSNLDRSFR